MIWHFLEIWLLVAVSFAVGCALGAGLYGLLADSPLALAQGAVADVVGDVVDWVKVRLGIGPAWRPELSRSLTRPGQSVMPDRIEQRIEPTSELARPPVASEEREFAAPPPAPVRSLERQPPAAVDDDFDDEPESPAEPTTLPAVYEEPPPLEPAPPPPEVKVVPMRPIGLSKPRGGVPDNLTRIRGIGQRNEEVLNTLGIYHFSQIAAWTPGEVLWIGRYLAFPERVERDDWVGQAMVLATGGDTGFEKSADRRRKRRAELRQQSAGDAAATSLALPPPSNAPDDSAKGEAEAASADEEPDHDESDGDDSQSAGEAGAKDQSSSE